MMLEWYSDTVADTVLHTLQYLLRGPYKENNKFPTQPQFRKRA